MVGCRTPVAVSSAVANSTTFFPTWSRAAVLAAGRHINDCLPLGGTDVFNAQVEGYTTPAVSDIGAASVRLRLKPQQNDCRSQNICYPLKDGGYLFGIRSHIRGGRFLPAVAGVPGQQGLDRYGQCRVGLAECVVMGRPVTDGTTTVLPDPVLQDWMPVGSEVEVVVLTKLTDFFLGLNAGTWLRIRIDDLATKGESWVREHCKTYLPHEDDTNSSQQLSTFLEGTGLAASGEIGPGIEDSNWAFQFWGGSGNAGVSGQVILLAEGTKMAAE